MMKNLRLRFTPLPPPSRCRIPGRTRMIRRAGLLLAAIFSVATIHAATITVQSTGDGAANAANCPGAGCRLRDAIAAAVSGDTVTFAAPLFDTPQVIDINGQLLIAKNLTITGKGANLLTIRNVAAPSSTSRVFQSTPASPSSCRG